MRSWKTTVGGIMAGLGVLIMGGMAWEHAALLGGAIEIIGLALMGVGGRDHDVTSEDAGAHA